MTRRRFVTLAAATAGGAALVTVGGLALTGTLGAGGPGVLLRTDRPLPPKYHTPLPIPAVAKPVRTDATGDHYEITQTVAPVRVFPDVMTPMWTYAGSFPGPTLVTRSGRRTVISHRNELAHPVVVHLHGGHTPHDSDGYPTDLILPVGSADTTMAPMPGMPSMPANTVVGTREYTYPLDQPAATLWYHDHRMGFTGPGIYYGLAGFHLVHDDEEAALGLPDGDRDIPLMICDRAFDAAGRLVYPSVDPTLNTPGVRTKYSDGVLGDVILVNGAPWPVAEVDRATYRLRVLNVSNARRYRLALDPPLPGGRGLVQIGSDAGLLDRPVGHDALELAPAERFDLLVDFGAYPAGTEVTVTNTLGSGSTATVMRFRVGGGSPEPARIPAKLAALPAVTPARAAVTRDFLFQNTPGTDGWRINGRPYDPAHPLATPRLGRPEIWRFTSDVHHPVHLHLDPFRVLGRGTGKPGEFDAGRKDTLDLLPAQSASVLVTFTDYPGRYVFHCHNLEHEDMAMMADFVTV